MSAQFTAASSQRLHANTLPSMAFPFTMACWYWPNGIAAGVNTIMAVQNPATALDYHALNRSTATMQLASSTTAGGVKTVTVASAFVANTWHFIVYRVISDLNKRASLIRPDGAIFAQQNTSGSAPTSLTQSSIGALSGSSASQFVDGRIAEFWVTDTDIQPDGLVLDVSTLRQLSLFGPFAYPHIGRRVVEYRSLRSRLEGWAPDEMLATNSANLTNVNGATVSYHPPIAAAYRGPRDFTRNVPA